MPDKPNANSERSFNGWNNILIGQAKKAPAAVFDKKVVEQISKGDHPELAIEYLNN